ncbi:MAG: ASCH domain-containing protein [Clostridia bacterium]|nr:ASCH domain-containing protein [Clostridia bacterium]
MDKNSDLEKWHFCDNKEDADKLFELVKSGEKTATSCLFCCDYKSDVFSVLTNWDETEFLLLETTKVEVVRFCDVTEEFTFKEGEGNKTHEDWRKIHRVFFESECRKLGFEFMEESLLICEEFRVVEEI